MQNAIDRTRASLHRHIAYRAVLRSLLDRPAETKPPPYNRFGNETGQTLGRYGGNNINSLSQEIEKAKVVNFNGPTRRMVKSRQLLRKELPMPCPDRALLRKVSLLSVRTLEGNLCRKS